MLPENAAELNSKASEPVSKSSRLRPVLLFKLLKLKSSKPSPEFIETEPVIEELKLNVSSSWSAFAVMLEVISVLKLYVSEPDEPESVSDPVLGETLILKISSPCSALALILEVSA